MSVRAGLLVILALSAAHAMPVLAADPQLKLPSFEHLQQVATESVNVTIGAWPLGIAQWALGQDQDSENQQIRELLRGLKSITVRSFDFARDHEYEESDLDYVRHQLSAPGWNALAQIRQHGDKEDNVDVYVSMEHEMVTGLAVIASGPRKLTIINIVGAVDPKKLAQISHHLGLPSVPM